MPPAARPCGRTAGASKRSSCASEVMNTAPRRLCAARPRRPPGRRPEPDDLPRVLVRRVVRRPALHHTRRSCRARAPTESARQRRERSTSRPARASTNSLTGAPPASVGGPASAAAPGGRARRAGPSGLRLVTTALSPRGGRRDRRGDRVVPGARPPPERRGLDSVVRASRPVEESSTRHGSSVTSSGTAASAGRPADSSSTVRRGVPNFLATSASSSETTLPQAARRIRGSRSVGDLAAELVALLLQLEPGELGQAGATASRGCSWSALD